MSDGESGHRLVDHTGDMALLVWAPSLPELFDESARALFDVIVDVASVRPAELVPIAVSDAVDRDDLLVRFLSELLFLHDARGWLFCGITVRSLDDHEIVGEAVGEPLDPQRHVTLRQVKAVTYHRVAIRKDVREWSATVVLDL